MSRSHHMPELPQANRAARRAFGRRAKKADDFARQRLQVGFSSPIKAATDDAEDEALVQSPGLQHWQELVLRYVDNVPIVSASTRYYDDSTKRVRYYLADKDTGDEIQGANPALEAIKILNANIDEISRAVGLRFLIGESRHTFNRDNNEFKTYGAGELFMRGGQYKMKSRSGKENVLDENLDAWRSYDPDRKWSDLATSSHKPMLDVMEAFVIAYAEERAVSIRLALNTGILAVSEDIFALGGSDGDATGSEGSDPAAALEARFHQMFTMTIKNPRDAASFVPPVVIVPGANVNQMIEHVSFAADRDKRKIKERIDMLKEEYAVGVDLPADIAKGFMADLNHWNAWSVDESAWKNYLAPKIQTTVWDAFQEICGALGINTEGLVVGLDNSQLISDKGMREAAFEAKELNIISDAAARRYAGFKESDAPNAADASTAGDDTVEVDEGVTSESAGGDGVTAAAATEGPNLDRLNRDIRKERLNFERELRDVIVEGARDLVDAFGKSHFLTSAADPDSFDPIERLAARIAGVIRVGVEALSLAAARALGTERAQEWYGRHAERIADRADRAGFSGAKLILDWLTVNKTTKLDGKDAFGIGRSIESLAAGGSDTINSNGMPTEARPATIMEDADFLSMIREEGSARPLYEWEHGGPLDPFVPHLDLDGVTWFADQERQVLNNPKDFPRSAIYHPGDHDGCTCRYEIKFERI